MIYINQYSNIESFAFESLKQACLETRIATNVYMKIYEIFIVDFNNLNRDDTKTMFDTSVKLLSEHHNSLCKNANYYVFETILYSIVVSCISIIKTIYYDFKGVNNIQGIHNYNLTFWTEKILKDLKHLNLEKDLNTGQ